MFGGNYREKSADSIEIPNIRWEAFEAMMHCLYTGASPPVLARLPSRAPVLARLPSRV